ncbi:MAG: ABC transporter ATP-binding protein [Fimbriimonadaceae bacterium]|nr:ABC transporter ATP-binding protein [Fimbriimonadaceae bacterium]
MSDVKPPVIEFKNVCKDYERNGQEPVRALSDLDFTVHDEEAGEFLAIIGPSGCGKSTILNMISGLLLPTQGEVRLLGELVTGPTSQAVTVQQAYTCFPWRTVLQNVEFGLEIQGSEAQERRQIAMDYLEKVGLADRHSAYPKELSGGMQQRTAIARALALKRPIVLMDEPFGALDAQTRSGMQQMLLSLWAVEKNTIIFVTHDIAEALLLADRILVLSPRPARIIHDMIVPFERPRNPMLQTDQKFVEMLQALMYLLKNPDTKLSASK